VLPNDVAAFGDRDKPVRLTWGRGIPKADIVDRVCSAFEGALAAALDERVRVSPATA
jgi:hypothetical protein